MSEIRNFPFEITRSESDGDGLTLEGYAVVFDSPATIQERGRQFVERIKPGALAKTLSERMPVLMFNHGQHPLIGDMPLGVIQSAREDARGVFIKARLASNWLIEPVREAVASGAVDGMSFRFSVPDGKETWRKGRGGALDERDVHEVRCPELGPVVFPAYGDTTVGVRSQELLDLLADDDVRADLARALLLADRSTSTVEAGSSTSIVEAAEVAEPTVGHSGAQERRARARRLRALALGVMDYEQA